jgi:hypothetical protein
MTRLHILITATLIALVLGAFGSMDLEAREIAADYEQEARAAARMDAQRLARELRMRGALDEGLTYPVEAK